MIYHLTGKITDKEKEYIVIDVGGVGYKVFVSEETRKRTKDQDTIYCFMQVTTKDIRLYGFKEKENLSFFKDLMKISGIGPKTAMQLASIAPMDEFKEAIENEDSDVIKKVFKIGKKKGERVIFELSRKSVKIEKDEVFELLKQLGFEKEEIEDVLGKIKKGMDKEEKIKEALRLLDKK